MLCNNLLALDLGFQALILRLSQSGSPILQQCEQFIRLSDGGEKKPLLESAFGVDHRLIAKAMSDVTAILTKAPDADFGHRPSALRACLLRRRSVLEGGHGRRALIV